MVYSLFFKDLTKASKSLIAVGIIIAVSAVLLSAGCCSDSSEADVGKSYYDYTITYDLSGGTNDPGNPDTYTVDTETIILKDPAKTGYSFAGWFDENGSRVIQIEKGSSGNINLTAKWQTVEYSITYVTDGGTLPMGNPVSYTIESGALALNGAERTGYFFLYWIDGSGEKTEEIPSGSYGDIVLTAVWSPIHYIVEFDGNGAAGGTMAAETFSYGEPKQLSKNKFTKIGYRLAGWAWSPDGEAVFGDGADVSNLTDTDGSKLKLYAVWEAADDTGSTGECTWVLHGTELTIKGNGRMADYSFENPPPWGTGVTSVNVENGVTYVGRLAFYCCGDLTSAVLADTVADFGLGAFWECGALSKIVLPYGMKDMPQNMFFMCTSLTEVILPSSLETIGGWAFSQCFSLRDIGFPESLKIIGQNAFYECRSLESLQFGSSFEKISSYAFYGCSSISIIEFDSLSLYIDESSFENCTSLTSVSVKALKTSVICSAFHGCSSLEVFSVDGVIVKLQESAFEGVSSLREVHLNAQYVSIGAKAFRNCVSLGGFEFAKQSTILGDYAFEGCTGITKLAFPSYTVGGGIGWFYGCSSLTDIVFGSPDQTIVDYMFDECISIQHIELPANLNELGKFCFSGCTSLEKVGWNGSISKIGDSCFMMCSSLKVLDLPMTVHNIGVNSFRGCTGLEKLDLRDYYITLNYRAFCDCTGLKYLVIGDETYLTSIEQFIGCNSLEMVEISRDLYAGWDTHFRLETKFLYEDGTTCLNFSTLKAGLYLNIGTGLAKVSHTGTTGDCTWAVAYNALVIYGSGVMEDYSAVNPAPWSTARLGTNDTNEIKQVLIWEGVTTIGSHAFDDCLHSQYSSGSAVRTAEIPDTVVYIDASAFDGCRQLNSVSFGNRVWQIGENAFRNCISLKTVVLPECICVIQPGAFSGCVSLESLSIGDNGWDIRAGAFSGCTGLKSIHLGHPMSNWSNVFQGCNLEFADESGAPYSTGEALPAGDYARVAGGSMMKRVGMGYEDVEKVSGGINGFVVLCASLVGFMAAGASVAAVMRLKK